jgi:hypothetical protein
MNIEPLFGYQIDQGNNGKFNGFSGTVNCYWEHSDKYDVGFQVQNTITRQYHSMDSSFTANPSLPLYAPANKTITAKFFSISFGNRFKLVEWNKHNMLDLILNIGLAFVTMDVSYSYDKTNYTILNPDESTTTAGLNLTPGVEYMRQFKKGKIIVQASISGIIYGRMRYPNSFVYFDPATFNIGYSIPVHSIRHEKK